jgi:methyltransferase (TIGR00027 family)
MTAEWVALIRAAEQWRAPAERVVDDPFAGRFLEEAASPIVAVGGAAGPVARATAAIFHLPFIGLGQATLARHRLLDDLLLAEVAAGASQAVILGAGYDARAYRFPPGRGGAARYFEVDHPTLSARKRTLAAKVAGGEQPHVRYVTVDFLREGIPERLIAEGFDPAVRTVFLWEGVTMYLTPAAVEATLAAVRGLAAPGSVIAFDVWLRSGGASPFDLVKNLGPRAVLRAIDEPLLSWFEPGGETPADLLRRAGFEPLFYHAPPELEAIWRRLAPGRTGYRASQMALVAGRR